MRLFTILSGLASIVSSVLTIFGWEASPNSMRATGILAIAATSAIAYLLHRYDRLARIIPELIHRKGACAILNELQDFTQRVAKQDFKTATLRRHLIALTNVAQRRVREIAGDSEDLQLAVGHLDAAVRAEDLQAYQTNVKDAFRLVHGVDRARLKEVRLEKRVYPGG